MPAEAGDSTRAVPTIVPRPDALTFYCALFGAEPTEFRLIHPLKEGRGKTRHTWGTLEHEADLEPLARLNAQGYGVYAVINRCAPSVEARCAEGRGARNEDITGIRAVFVDMDGDEATTGEHLARLEAAPLPPSLVVCSGLPHKLHAYWLVADLPVSEFERVQKHLAAFFGSDPSVSNPARVMRVPGFVNTKPGYEKPAVRLLERGSIVPLRAAEHVYTRAEVLEGFAVKLEPPKPLQRPTVSIPQDAERLRRYALSALQEEADTLSSMREGNRNNQTNTAAFNLGQFIPHGLLSREEIEDALSAAALACGLSERETASALRSGIEAGLKKPRDVGRPEHRFGSVKAFGSVGADQNLLPSLSAKSPLGQSILQRGGLPRLGGRPCL